ncbi:hypothetical protein ACFL6U_28280 [Planctomycetota bacterium]
MRSLTSLSVLTLAVILMLGGLTLNAQDWAIENWQVNPERELNPNTQWLREAKWGLFTHYLVHMPSAPIPEGTNAEKWNKKVNSFQVKTFADQLTELKVPYFFITIGQGGGYYCSPNATYERLFGSSHGKLSKRDLVADLAEELNSRGIRLCVYLPALGRGDSPEKQQMYRDVVTEWSKRWSKSVSAWWIDGAAFQSPDVFKAYTAAFKAGNPKALVAYNVGPVGMNRRELAPVTDHEDFLAGECDYFLPTSGPIPRALVRRKIFSNFQSTDCYQGPNIAGDQLHFLNFLGAWWGTGEPRFPNALVNSWTQHVIDHAGAVTWDLPLTEDGIIPEAYFKQVKSLSESINKDK